MDFLEFFSSIPGRIINLVLATHVNGITCLLFVMVVLALVAYRLLWLNIKEDAERVKHWTPIRRHRRKMRRR